MSDEHLLEAVHVLNPRTLERARRLAVALMLLRVGISRREAVAAVRLRFNVGRIEAWRLVNMASDIAGKL
jgi:hypothetical protein